MSPLFSTKPPISSISSRGGLQTPDTEDVVVHEQGVLYCLGRFGFCFEADDSDLVRLESASADAASVLQMLRQRLDLGMGVPVTVEGYRCPRESNFRAYRVMTDAARLNQVRRASDEKVEHLFRRYLMHSIAQERRAACRAAVPEGVNGKKR